MSRTGKAPIDLPSGVTMTQADGRITVKGKNGELTMPVSGNVEIVEENGKLTVKPVDDSKRSRAMWGTTRSLLNAMVEGANTGFTRRLEIQGVGYRAAVNGNILSISLGYSHEIRYVIPAGIKIVAPKPTSLEISGASKQRVGQVAAEIRALRKPEPYKGKGVRYDNEKVRRKEGKKK